MYCGAGRRFRVTRRLVFKVLVIIIIIVGLHHVLDEDYVIHMQQSWKNSYSVSEVTETLENWKKINASAPNVTKPGVNESYCAHPINEISLNTSTGGVCQMASLDPFHPDAMKDLSKIKEPLRCKVKERASLRAGVLRITGSDVSSASYKIISRPKGKDFDYNESDEIKVTNFESFPVQDEYIALTLKLTVGDTVTEYLMQAVRKPELVSRKSVDTKLGLSVLIIGIDSISNAHAQRKLPLSYNYIKDVLGGYIFMGHSTVGDGTTEQVAAFLTGQGEQEYQESRRGKPNATTVDGWNWIYKRAKRHGYVTSYSEDMTSVGTFQYRLMGFENQPTDYYPRPFMMVAERTGKGYCIGSQKIYNYQLDLPRQIYEVYKDKKKFLFHFVAEISHSDRNTVELLDRDLLQFMTDFKDNGYLDNTVLLVLGDHGWRGGDFRETMQGKLEERLPLFSMIFPKRFKESYPELAENLATNTQRLTSWFDVYATFNHFFDYPEKPKDIKHGMSLFDKVPADRSCQDAGIPEHWCPCIQWTAVDTHHDHVRRAAVEAMNHINNLMYQEPLAAKQCLVVKLDTLRRAEVQIPSNKVSKFKRSDGHGRVPEYTKGTPRYKNNCLYQLMLVALPNNAVFEASVHYLNGRFSVKGSVSRLNRYGDQPKCIADSFPHLRKYCQCK